MLSLRKRAAVFMNKLILEIVGNQDFDAGFRGAIFKKVDKKLVDTLRCAAASDKPVATGTPQPHDAARYQQTKPFFPGHASAPYLNNDIYKFFLDDNDFFYGLPIYEL